jgi:hypothetical protein
MTKYKYKVLFKQMSNWGSAKTLKDIADAYSAVYEAKKKVDQDQDGDNDFADVRIARMIASGVPKEKAIAMVKDKSYNEEVEAVDEKYMGFKKLEASIAAKGGVRDAGAVAASIGRNKYGKKKFQKAAATDHKLGEENSLDEGIRSTIKGLFSKKKEEEAPKPESRGDQLRKRYNVGPEGSDTSAKRKILNRAKGNAERAQTQVNMGNASQSYADRAKGAHDSYLKAGYSKYGADIPYQGRGNKARKRAAAMTAHEAYELVALHLLENKFASTIEDADNIIRNMSDNWMAEILEG